MDGGTQKQTPEKEQSFGEFVRCFRANWKSEVPNSFKQVKCCISSPRPREPPAEVCI